MAQNGERTQKGESLDAVAKVDWLIFGACLLIQSRCQTKLFVGRRKGVGGESRTQMLSKSEEEKDE